MAEKRKSVSVLFANPNVMTGELVMQALNRRKHIHVVATATSARQVLDVVRSGDVDVALISANLEDGPLSGIGVLRQISEHHSKVRSVVLYYSPECHLIADAFRAGARGVFCLSQSTSKLLYRCVEQVHAGQIWANTSELVEVVEALSQRPPMRVVDSDGIRLLTTREEEVVRLVADGMQNREIAKKLELSEHTIKNYLFHIFDKLGVSSRVELVLYAVSNTKNAQIAATQSTRATKKLAENVKTGGELSTVADQASAS
jgi:DNA-binding NarL/FixJ family response regulator